MSEKKANALAKFSDWSKSELATSLVSARHAYKNKAVVGGVGPAAVTWGTSLTLRHLAFTFLGPANKASTVERVFTCLVMVAAAAFRIGVGHRSDKTSVALAASVAEGIVGAAAERLLESLSGLQPD